LIIAITGASGAIYGIRTLRANPLGREFGLLDDGAQARRREDRMRLDIFNRAQDLQNADPICPYGRRGRKKSWPLATPRKNSASAATAASAPQSRHLGDLQSPEKSDGIRGFGARSLARRPEVCHYWRIRHRK
jgi:hypothetical protein